MKIFTYNQYIKCIHTLRLNAVLQLAEEGEEYQLENTNKRYSHNKLVKNILKDKKEAEKFINYFIKPQKHIKAEELEIYTSSYITKKYKSKEVNLVYKLKNQEIFFLIEHQSTVDNAIPYKMLNYCIDIIQEWSKNKKIGKKMKYPIVVPIVIYIGDRKWDIPKKFGQKQISNYVFERYKLKLEYNLIDINKISKQTLLEQGTMFGYSMLIEKSKTKEELIDNIVTIIKITNDEKKLDKLADIIDYLLSDILEEDVKQELLEKINTRVGENNMGTLYDRILDENRNLIKKGKKESQVEIVKNMLNKKLDDGIILETTGIKKHELENIKKKILIVN